MTDFQNCSIRQPQVKFLRNRSAQIGRVQGHMTQIAPVVCMDMQLTDAFVQYLAKDWLFIVASFPLNGEPLIHGFGVKADQAWALAKFNRATPDAVLCARQPTDEPTWKSALGQLVTIAHVTTRKQVTQ